MANSFKLVIGNRVTSSWSLRGWLAVAWSKQPHSVDVINMYTDTSKADLANASPTGLVPLLHANGLVIWDTLAIIEYLNELDGNVPFWPADQGARALARSVSAEMHSGFSALRQECPMNLRRKGVSKEISDACQKDIKRISDIWINCRMRYGAASSDGPYLFGAFTAADIMYAPVVTRFLSYGIALEDIPQQYCAAIMRHPLMAEWWKDAALETYATPYENG